MTGNILALALISSTQTFDLPPGLLSALCFVESSHRTYVVNHKDGGSRSNGACQIKLSTAKLLGYNGTEEKLLDPKVNAYWAAKYLRRQLDRYGGDVRKGVAAYNSGTLRINDMGHIRNQKYVNKVFRAWGDNR
jgi:hypothetical protein